MKEKLFKCQFVNEPIASNHKVEKAKGGGVFSNADKCEICGSPPTKSLIKHHISYEPELTIGVCGSCHRWLHGHGVVSNHKFKRDFAQMNRGWPPYVFALAVCRAYEAKLQEYVASTLKNISGVIH